MRANLKNVTNALKSLHKVWADPFAGGAHASLFVRQSGEWFVATSDTASYYWEDKLVAGREWIPGEL